MHVYIVATSIVFGLATVCLLTVLAMLCDAQFRTWRCSFPAVACVTLLGFAVSMVKNYDSIAVKRADEFFSTRSSAYSCELPDGYACKLKLVNWQKDSVYWHKTVDEILRRYKNEQEN